MPKAGTRIIRFVLLISFAGGIWPQNAARAQAPQTTEPRKTSEPYTGDLSIFDSPGRDERLQINRVMDILGIQVAKSVADIGAGSGWFTVRAAKRVGGLGVVYAVDINPEAVEYIGKRAEKEKLQNVKTILSKPDDPSLPAGSCRAAAQDLSRGGASGGVAEELAGSVAPGGEDRDHRSQR